MTISFLAQRWSHGESEAVGGKALLGGRQDDVVLATKVSWSISGIPTIVAPRAAGIVRQGREFGGGRDWIDLDQIHRGGPDPH